MTVVEKQRVQDRVRRELNYWHPRIIADTAASLNINGPTVKEDFHNLVDYFTEFTLMAVGAAEGTRFCCNGDCASSALEQHGDELEDTGEFPAVVA